MGRDADDDGGERGGRSYDYVVVGAGPAACGLLHGLLRDHDDGNRGHDDLRPRVRRRRPTACVVESGPATVAPTYARDWPKTALADNAPRNFATTPQRHLDNRVLDVPVGAGPGGGSNVNACLVCDPDFENDFRRWPGRFRDGTLVEEACRRLREAMRENGGLVKWEACPKFLDVVGGGRRDDGGEFSLENVTLATGGEGRRVNYFDSLVGLGPLLTSDEHEFAVATLTNTVAERLLWDSTSTAKRVSGVVCRDQASGERFVLGAAREIILCAGAIHSPALLMRSGIGDEAALRRLQLDIWKRDNNGTHGGFHDLPGVGKNLKDHVVVPRAFLTPSQRSCRRSLMGAQAMFAARDGGGDAQFMLMDGRVLGQAGPLLASAAFRRDYLEGHLSGNEGDHSVGAYIWHYVFRTLHALVLAALRWAMAMPPLAHLVGCRTATVLVTLLRPQSSGSVTLTSSNDVLVDPAYLSRPADQAVLVNAWRRSSCLRDAHLGSCWEVLPGPAYRLRSLLARRTGGRMDEDDILAYARHFAQPYFHWVGTCAMDDARGSNDAVVDEEFRVIGMQGLRVCDASVFVDCVSAPTALTCAALGHILSDLLRRDVDREARGGQRESVRDAPECREVSGPSMAENSSAKTESH